MKRTVLPFRSPPFLQELTDTDTDEEQLPWALSVKREVYTCAYSPL